MNYSLGNGFLRNRFDLFEHNNMVESEYLRTDIYEKEDAYYLKMEVPGIEKSNIEVSYENSYLTVTVKEDQNHEEISDYIRKERISSEKERTFYVGEVNEDSIKASCENGILTIRIEKQEEPTITKKQITIE